MDYITEAFRKLELLDEDVFNVSDSNDIEELSTFVDDVDNDDDLIAIIDAEAENEDEIEDSYVGKIILECDVCHSLIYKDKDDVEIEDDYANINEECPYCFSVGGFKIVGKVADFSDEDEQKEDEEPEEESEEEIELDVDGDGDTDIEVEVKDDEEDEDIDESLNESKRKFLESFNKRRKSNFLESLKAIISKLDEAEMSDEEKRDNEILKNIYNKTQVRKNARLTDEEQAVLDKYGLYRDQDYQTVRTNAGRNDVFSGANSMEQDYSWRKNQYISSPKKEVNFVDKAKKIDARAADNPGKYYKSAYDRDFHGKYNGKYYTNRLEAEREDDAIKMQEPVYNMKTALDSRKYHAGKSAKLASERDDRIKAAQDKFNREITDANRRYDSDSKYHRDSENRANSVINKLLKRESFINAIKDLVSRLNEAEMSDEDRADSDLLRSIYNKTQERANARLTPEEKAVLDKYDLTRDTYSKNIRTNKNSRPLMDRDTLKKERRGYWDSGYVPKQEVNFADRARKMPERQANRANRGYFDRADYFDDYTSEKDRDRIYNSGTYSWDLNGKEAERVDLARDMKEPVNSMKAALRTRKSAQKSLDTLAADRESEIKDATDAFSKKISSINRDYDYRSKSGNRDLKNSQSTINKLLKKESLDEDIENLSLDTDDTHLEMTSNEEGRVEIVTEPRQEEVTDEVIVPVDDADIAEIEADEPEIDDAEMEAPEEMPGEEQIDFDEFDEESFDEMAESYLKESYDNVTSFKTSKVYTKDGKVIVEGIIGFNSGSNKNTQFIFSKNNVSKTGKVRFIGENAQITKGKKAFRLTGKIDNKSFISESLNYNYKVDGSKVYGTSRRAVNEDKDLSTVEGSMTKLIQDNHADLDASKSKEELLGKVKKLFDDNNLNTPASKRLVMNIAKSRNLNAALQTVYNSLLAGSDLKVK